ncbi:ArsR/SmtB family transcription factor [Lachnospiraceae bacterium LCP25S3_G4]
MTNAETAKMFKAFCDERRLEILAQLQLGEFCAAELIEKLHMGQSTLSHHMQILCISGVVIARKEGNYMFYTISQEGSKQIKEILEGITNIRGYKT